MTNSIPADQNLPPQLERLAAQRQLYATAKTVLGWQVVLSGPVTVAIAFTAIWIPELKAYAALWGILLSLVDVLLLTPLQKRIRTRGACVQEQFDCDVLQLSWDELRAGKCPEPELIGEQAAKYQRWAASMPPLTNWYAREVGDLPLHIARIICQRSNCWWDAKQRRYYAVGVVALVFVVFVAVLGLGMANGQSLEDFVVRVAAPLLPAIILAIRQCVEQFDTASRLDSLKEHAERIWEYGLAKSSKKREAEVTAKSRDLQSEILEVRKRSPLIFDWVFKRLRGRYERQMSHGAVELVAEAKKKLELSG